MPRSSPPAAKRCFDVALTLVTAPVWLPVLGACALLVWMTLGRPVLFTQTRPGLHGEPFTMVKLRTMRSAPAQADTPLRDPDEAAVASDASRTPAVGRLLRRLGLDELPELFLVLTGTMSLVGPRPLLMSYLPRFTPRQRRRHELPPGITGLAQVSGRTALPWEESLELDVWYVEHWSVRLDALILWRTVRMTLGSLFRRNSAAHMHGRTEHSTLNTGEDRKDRGVFKGDSS